MTFKACALLVLLTLGCRADAILSFSFHSIVPTAYSSPVDFAASFNFDATTDQLVGHWSAYLQATDGIGPGAFSDASDIVIAQFNANLGMFVFARPASFQDSILLNIPFTVYGNQNVTGTVGINGYTHPPYGEFTAPGTLQSNIPVPEPAPGLLVLTGLLVLGAAVRYGGLLGCC